ncbi:peptidase [Peribacillus loiseleuriae]|uniref:Peptidase n=1 Tax=Peribacillus loiseleuriae TaxID=1679170 RepID=A0A0K9GZT7_9BACI|nr:C40 family peptidase [Peribacillus loiseleuriae]KMY52244.1 peptidase [Peribacillus loiseleuriae]
MRKKLLVLSTTAMLGLGSIVAVPAVQAESINDLQNQQQAIQGQRSGVQSEIDTALAKIKALQIEQATLTEQILRIEQAINDNNAKIDETKVQIAETNAEIKKLKEDIVALQKRIEQRNEVLKERAVSYQESGGNVSYVEVLLGATSFGNFIDRVGAVATMVEADQDILTQHEADKKELEEKQTAVETKLADLTSMKLELEGMLAQIEEQKSQSVQLSASLKGKEQETATLVADLKKRDANLAAQVVKIQGEITAELNRQAEIVAAKKRAEAEAAIAAEKAAREAAKNIAKESTKKKSSSESFVTKSLSSNSSTSNENNNDENNNDENTVSIPSSRNLSVAITAGNKYIGNSVYVFGGGRSQSDINNGRFDCSAFVYWAYDQAGINLGSVGNTDTLLNYGTRVSASDLQPGDMVFFDTYKKNGHVGIYVGGGKFIGSQSSTGVAIANMSSGYWAQHFNGRVHRF